MPVDPEVQDSTPGWPDADPLTRLVGVHRGRAPCVGLLRQVLCGMSPAAVPGCPPLAASRRLWLIDPHFTDWPLGDTQVLASLTAWLRQPGRRLHLMAQDFGPAARAHPRLARWRRDWSHGVEAWQPVEGPLTPGLRGLWLDNAGLQWLDAPDWRMRGITEAVHLRAASAQIADFLQRCEPAWPATTLGL